MAADCGSIQILKALILRRFSPNEISNGFYRGHRCHPIHFACVKGHLPIVKFLVENFSVGIGRSDSYDSTPFSLTLTSSKLDVVEYLLDRGAELEDMGELSTALKIVLKMHNPNVTKRLIMSGEKLVNEGYTLLHHAASTGSLDIVDAVLDFGVDVDTLTDKDKDAPFLMAALYGRLSVMEMLHSRGADPDSCDRYGETALHRATSASHHDVVRYLLVQLNVALDRKNRAGETAFCIAVRKGSVPLIHLFLEAGYFPGQKWLFAPEERVFVYLKDVCSNPRTLLKLACFKIRSILARRIPEVDSLPLPKELKDAVRLTQIR